MEPGESDEDDPVVREVDVFISKSLKDLYLVQHQVRPKHVPKEKYEENLKRARIKPVQQMMEFEYQLNCRDSSYDYERGAHLARTIDGGSKDDEKYFRSGVMDRQVKQTVKAAPSCSRYVVGCLVEGQVHITPLRGTLQLQPTFDYLDRRDTKQREQNRLENDEALSDEEEATQQVTVKFANTDKERTKKLSDKSFRTHQQMLDDEPWIDVEFNKQESEAAEFERRGLIYNCVDRQPVQSFAAPNEYLQVLLPKDSEVERVVAAPSAPDNLSLAQQKALPLEDRIHALLKSAKVIHFNELISLFSGDDETMKRLVQEAAVLVQGCWVIKSDRLYPKDARSSRSGVSNEILVRGRDFILWKFTTGRFVSRKEMAKATKLPPEDLEEILEGLAVCRLSLEWEFLLDTDLAFVEKHTQVADRQQKLWDIRSKKFQAMLKESPETKSSPEAKSPRTKCRQSDDRVVTDAGVEELVSFVREKLELHRCVSLSELKRLLTQKLASSPPGHVLGRGISDKLLAQAAETAGARVLDIKWPNDSQQEAVFALTAKGDSCDSWRTQLLEMFKTNSRYRKKNIHKKIEEELKTALAESELGQLLAEYCVNRNGWYYLKGVVPASEKKQKTHKESPDLLRFVDTRDKLKSK
uniref:DNA-directed RNA polymerase III subunit RPC5 C-terminal domain-containing protein n=1 Tax=Strigamia maritima TaxID=126957 RepID=T1J1G5_STRMM